jgi:hypothetical protein
MNASLDLAGLTIEHFLPLLGQSFSIHLPEGTELPLALSEAVAGVTAAPVGQRTAFSLSFRCAQLPKGQYLRQGCYRIDNPALGSMEIFITPIQPDALGMRYQAVFG